MNIDDIQNSIDESYVDAINGSFGLWIDGLYGWLNSDDIESEKQAFYILLRRVLHEKKPFCLSLMSRFESDMCTYTKIQ